MPHHSLERVWSELDTTITENSATPGKAVELIGELIKKATAFYALVETTHNDLKGLGFSHDYTGEADYEVGALFPSAIFGNNVEGLSAELKIFDRHIRTFGELAGQDVSSPTIRAIADGSLDIFVNALPDVASAIGSAIEKIVIIYLSILQIRQLRDEAKKREMPDDIVKQMEKHEKEKIGADIDKLADEMIKHYGKKIEKGRSKELRGHLVRALRYMAQRIDCGADFEVTPPETGEEVAADASEEIKQAAEAKEARHNELRLKGASLIQLPTRIQPILALPEPKEDEDKSGSK